MAGRGGALWNIQCADVARARRRWMREQGMLSSHEGDRLPMPLRDMIHQSLAADAPAMQPHHLGIGGCLIDEHQPGRVNRTWARRVHVSYFAQIADGQRRKRIIIESHPKAFGL